MYVEKNIISSEYIDSFWFSDNNNKLPQTSYNILPDGCTDIVFEFSPLSCLAFAYGTTVHSKKILLKKNTSYLGVKLKPGVEVCSDKFCTRDLINNSIDLRSSDFKFNLNAFLENLHNLKLFCEKIDYAQSIFEKNNVFASKMRVNTFLNYIHSKQGNLSIGDLVQRFKLSERQLERVFKEQNGISPKLYCRITRFQMVMNTIKLGKFSSMSDLALDFGYSDQSHMNRDFREFSGKTPLDTVFLL